MSSKKSKRQKSIIDALGANPSLRVSKLASSLGVTTETIRRDLEELEEQKLISRTYGGAVLKHPYEASLSERHKEYQEERIKIAKLAVPLLKGAHVIMIGSGATTVHVARRIAFEMNNITVITHSFGVATVLSLNPTIKIIMAPGEYYAEEGAVLGSQTHRFLCELSADWVILGASGIAADGASDALIESAEVYRTMITCSTQSLIVADHTKFDRIATARFGLWHDIDYLVTDTMPQGNLQKALGKNAVDVKITD